MRSRIAMLVANHFSSVSSATPSWTGDEPDMVMGVDEARQQRLFAVAYDRRAGIGGAQIRKRAYRDDDSVPLQHSAVIDLLPPMAIKRARDDMLAAHDRN